MIKKLFGLWAAVRRQTIQQDIDSELAYHVEMRTRDLRRPAWRSRRRGARQRVALATTDESERSVEQ